MNKPLVSVAMVVCNVDRFLAQSIESVLDQTFRDFEFNIVDFGSTDKTKEIVASYSAKDNRVRLSEIPHCGLAQARNASCRVARGRYIAIQDADDISLPNRLTNQVEFMEGHPEVGLLGGAVTWIDAQSQPRPSLAQEYPDYPTEDHELRKILNEYCPFWQPTVLIRTEAFTQAGGYRVAFDQSEDYDLWLRISERFQCANLKQTLVRYRVHPQQSSFRKRTQQIFCGLAAQGSASLRKAGTADPLDEADAITPAVLLRLGISPAAQQAALAKGYRHWIEYMYLAGEHEAALSAAVEMLQSSDWKGSNPRDISDVYIITARMYWRDKKFVRSFLAISHAVMARPKLAARQLKPLLPLYKAVSNGLESMWQAIRHPGGSTRC